jgi:hypothetical protein
MVGKVNFLSERQREEKKDGPWFKKIYQKEFSRLKTMYDLAVDVAIYLRTKSKF